MKKKMIDENYIAKKAISLYGEEAQIWMAIEEMAELNNALAKLRRNRVTNEEVCEEIADVVIMMLQLSYIFGSDNVNNKIESKMERLEEILKKYENRVKNQTKRN